MKQTQQKQSHNNKHNFGTVSLTRAPHRPVTKRKPARVCMVDDPRDRKLNRGILSQAVYYKQQRDLIVVVGGIVFIIVLFVATYFLMSSVHSVQRMDALYREVAYERDIYASQLKDMQNQNIRLRSENEALHDAVDEQNAKLNNYRQTLVYYGLLDE